MKKIPVHPVSTGAKKLFLSAIAEIENTRVLKETANNGTYAYVLGNTRDTGP